MDTPTLKTEYCYDASCLVTGGTSGCRHAALFLNEMICSSLIFMVTCLVPLRYYYFRRFIVTTHGDDNDAGDDNDDDVNGGDGVGD